MSACWGGVPDDEYSTSLLIASCRTCGELFASEAEDDDDQCRDCFRRDHVRDSQYRRAIRRFFAQTETGR